MGATNPSRRVMRALVQTARAWPEGDSGSGEGWELQQRLRPLTGSEGAGQILGHLDLEQDIGRLVDPNGRELLQVARVPTVNPDAPRQSLAGRWIRLLLRESGGAVSLGGEDYAPIWHGVVDRPILDPDGAPVAGGLARWSCVGLPDVLNRIYLWRGFEWHRDRLVDTGDCPVFNAVPGGDRSADKHTLFGIESYVFERGADSSGRRMWRARDVIEYALAGFSRGYLYGDGSSGAGSGSGPMWELGPGASLLEYDVGRLDWSERTIAELLNTLINPSRGLIWRPRVVSGKVQIVITSTNRTATTINSVTIPAATPTPVNLAGDLWLANPGIQEETDYYDWITLHAARPWVAITLWWRHGDAASSLLPDGWVVTDEPGAEPASEHRYRRFKLNPEWIGEQYPGGLGIGLRNTLDYSETGATGSRQFGGYTPSPSALEITRLLPYAQGFGSSKDGPRQAPIVVIGSGSSWVDYSDSIDVTPTEDPAGLLLGPSLEVAKFLKLRLQTGANALLVTVGVREWAPFTLAWRRQGEYPRDLPRILRRRVPDCEEWVGLQGTVRGVSGGALVTNPSDDVIRTDAAAASASLALLVARYGGEGASFAYGQDGVIDHDDARAPGSFCDDVQIGGSAMPANAVITRRGWDFRFETYGTTYRFERLPIDAQSRP
jgi:hypothetical protein